MSLDRDCVLAMLASYGERPVDAVDERIDSLDLAWLLYEIERRFAVPVRLGDADLARIVTVDDAVAVLGPVVGGTAALGAANHA
ncbi:acyl carrier protein [Longispora urticae]